MVGSVTIVIKDKFKPTMDVSTFYLDDRSLLDWKKLTSWYSQYYAHPKHERDRADSNLRLNTQ